MKPKEFYRIVEQFIEEDKRWRALKVGDIVYDSQARGGEMDYHKMQVDTIDIDERQITAHDVEGSHTATLGHFLTQNEFIKRKF